MRSAWSFPKGGFNVTESAVEQPLNLDAQHHNVLYANNPHPPLEEGGGHTEAEIQEQLSKDLDEWFPELFGPDRNEDPPPEGAIATRNGESESASRAALLDYVPFSVKQKLKPNPAAPAQQPPYGYTWSGECLVKKTNRSRPDAVDHSEWKGMSKRQRATAIEEHERKLREKNEAQYREAIKATPAMPVLTQSSEEHRERLKNLYSKKLHQIVDEMYALVAKVLSPKECQDTEGTTENLLGIRPGSLKATLIATFNSKVSLDQYIPL